MKHFTPRVLSNALRHGLGAIAVGTLVAVAQPSLADYSNGATERQSTHSSYRMKEIQFDISENAKRFIFDETPLTKDKDGNDVPGDGNEFKTEGYIYAPGTLGGDGDGVNADGSAQYPDKVIGRWYCWGFHVGNGGATETGPVVITNQLYDFGDKVGRRTITSAGLELIDIGVPIKRAITGGTGRYNEARGEAVQRLIGFNGQKGVNLRVKLKIRSD